MLGTTWVLQGMGAGTTTGGGILPSLNVYSPAYIVSQFLIDNLITSLPTGASTDVWPSYTSSQPAQPINVVTLYDTGGILSGRKLRSGETIRHRGIGIRIRGTSYPVGYAKAEQIYEVIQSAVKQIVTFDNATFRLDNISPIRPIAAIGQEPETRKDIFTIDARVSLTPILLP